MKTEKVTGTLELLAAAGLSYILARIAQNLSNADPEVVAARRAVADELRKAAADELQKKEKPKEVRRLTVGRDGDGVVNLIIMSDGEVQLSGVGSDRVLVTLVTDFEFWTRMHLFQSDVLSMTGLVEEPARRVASLSHPLGCPNGKGETIQMRLDLDGCLQRDGFEMVEVSIIDAEEEACAFITIPELMLLVGLYDDAYEKGLIEHVD